MTERDYIYRAQAALGEDDHILKLRRLAAGERPGARRREPPATATPDRSPSATEG